MVKIVYFRALLGAFLFSGSLEIVERILNLEKYTQVFPEPDNLYWALISIVVIGPFIETLLIQIGLTFGFRLIFAIILDNQDTKSDPVLVPSVILTSLIFGLIHMYNLVYMFIAIIPGLFFGYIYYLAMKKDIKPLFPVFVAHAVYNLCVMILDGYFGFFSG